MKRLHTLCVALLALVLCNTPLFAEDFAVRGIYYNITSSTNKTVAVTYRGSDYSSYSNEYSGAITIPESVTYNGSTYSVTSIGDQAFEICSSLTSVEIPNSVTSIGERAFYECDGLTSVVIPNSVASIGKGAFSGCSSLTSIAVAEDNQTYDSRNNCNAIIETQTNTLIVGCSNTTIPNSVTSIGYSAFSWCSSLTSVEIPNSVTSIGNSAFYYCTNLTSVEIPNGVTSIGAWAFSCAWSLTSVVIPNRVTRIERYSFYSCLSLTSVVIPNSVTSIREGAFKACPSLTSVEIPSSVTHIGDAAFSDCSSLTTATVGCSWKTKPLYKFDENVTVNATLHSYENGVCTVCGEEETTGIDGITSNVHQRSEIFDLQGRRVSNPGKGLYIVNGKKVIMK